MKYIHLWIGLAFFTVFSHAEFIDIKAPVGENHTCVKEISSLLQTVYRHYPSISASQKMILAANAQLKGAKWNYFPTPSVDFSHRAGYQGATYRLDQPLWTGGKLDATRDQATAQVDEAQYTLGETSYMLSEKVLNVLQNYIEADGGIKAFSEGKKELEVLSKMLSNRIGAGVSSEGDRELINARIAQIDSDLMMAQSNYAMSRSQLELLLGKKLDCTISFSKDHVLNENVSLQLLQNEMVATHPTLKKMKAQINIAKAEKKSADAAIMPNISVRAEHSGGSVYYENMPMENLVYVNVSASTGAGLSALSNMEAAKYKVMQSEDQLSVQEQELKDKLVADYQNYTSSVGRAESISKTIVASEKVLDSYQRLFIAGKREWLDLVNTSREVTQNKVTLAQLRAVWVASAYRLALQTGRIHFDKKAMNDL